MLSSPGAVDCVVVGGGVIGRSIAMMLQTRGVATTLIDPDPAVPPASWGNAGHIATEQVEPLASWKTLLSLHRRLFVTGGALALPPSEARTWVPFVFRLLAASGPRRFADGTRALAGLLACGLPAWRRLLSTAGASELLAETGHYVVWESASTAAAGKRAWAAANTGTAVLAEPSVDVLEQLNSLLKRPVAGAVRLTGTAQVTDLTELSDALKRTFNQQGGRTLRASATRLQVSGDQATAILDSGEEISADALIIAAGVASGGLLEELGFKAPVIAERGYHIQAPLAEWPRGMPPVVFEDRSMIVTGFRSGLRAASFVEFGRAATRPDARKWERLEAHVQTLGLPMVGRIDRWMGVRPTLPDYLPAIGRSMRASNIYYAFGHQHLGLTLAAVTAEIMADLVTGKTPPVDLAPFSLERFCRRTQ